MIDQTMRAAAIGLLASTALASPAFAQAAAADTTQPAQEQVPVDPANAPSTQAAPEAAPSSDESNVIIVTAQKREENLQNVPISIQAIGTRRLDQLNIDTFEQYTKQLPSVSFQTAQPGVTVVYMRGVATGGDGNHSGSLPSVGSYLDEQPITTIGGTLDVHIYDIARIESLAGPQGTLYGASSQAGTIRIITNKPELGVTSGRVDGEINTVAHGDVGGKLEGMINLPLGDSVAFRGVAFYRHDGGYIDNVFGERDYLPDPGGFSFENSDLVEDNFNELDVYGGRAALKIDLNDNWTVTPTVMHQYMKADGTFFFDPELGDLNIDRFFDEVRKDKFTQAALTIEGKLGNWDVTYAGAYMNRKTYSTSDYTDYADAYDALYADYGGLAGYFYFFDANGDPIDPRQTIKGTDHFKKLSQEIRIASPQDKPLRLIAGAFFQRQSNDIYQNYLVENLAPQLSVNGLPGTLWLTKQERIDKDYALFGEVSYDITPQITLTGGGRLYKFNNSLFGFAGFGRDPNGPPWNVVGSSRTGVAECFTEDGTRVNEGSGAPAITDGAISGTPCTNVGVFDDGKVKPKRAKDSGFTHRVNAQYKPNDDLMFYATWSRGFRPGGINRRAELPGYDPDFLTNFEVGWKTTWADGAVRWNGAIYHQIWKKFQFSFLGLNSLTVIQNGNDAEINGIESDVSYVRGGLTLNAAAAYTNAKTSDNVCAAAEDDKDCSNSFVTAPEGTRLPITPRFKAAATARYAWPVSFGRAHVQGAISHQSSARATLRTNVGSGDDPVDPASWLGKLRAFTLVDAAAGVDFGRFNVELFARNIFDKRNDLSRFTACSVCTRTLVVPGTPRVIGLRAGTRF